MQINNIPIGDFSRVLLREGFGGEISSFGVSSEGTVKSVCILTGRGISFAYNQNVNQSNSERHIEK